MRYQDNPIHRLWGTSSLANIYKKDTPGQKPMKNARKIIEAIVEAKIGDKVSVVHGSQKGLVGHVGEIRKGLGGRDHTYTIDYDDNGKRASVQVKKAHVKKIQEATVDVGDIEKKKAIAPKDKETIAKIAQLMKKEKKPLQEGGDELNKKTPTEDEIMKKHGISKTEFDYQLAIGMKVEMEHTKNAMVARQIALDHLGEKPDYYSKLKKMVEGVENIDELKKSTLASYLDKTVDPVYGMPRSAKKLPQRMKGIERASRKMNEEEIMEVSKRLLSRYISKAAGSMSSASFGHGQASAQYKEPSEADKRTLSKRMKGIETATSRLTKEEIELIEQSSESLKKMSDYHYKEADWHARKAGELESGNSKRTRHTEASNHHKAASDHYNKASQAKDKETIDYHTSKAENHADAAEEHERKHGLMEDVSQVQEDKDQEHFTVHAFTPALKHIDTPSKHSSKKEADNEGHNYSAQGHVVVHHKADGSKKVATASFEPGTSAFAKSEMKQRALNYKNVQEQELLSRGNKLEKARKNFSMKKSREAYIHHKDRESHLTHNGAHYASEETINEAPSEMKSKSMYGKSPIPHVVSVTLTHPNEMGPIHKKVKVTAKSPAHASEIAEKHYEKKGYKIEKVHYATSMR